MEVFENGGFPGGVVTAVERLLLEWELTREGELPSLLPSLPGIVPLPPSTSDLAILFAISIPPSPCNKYPPPGGSTGGVVEELFGSDGFKLSFRPHS